MRVRSMLIPLLFLGIIPFSFANAQWVQTNGPYGGCISSFTANANYLFAGTQTGGVYRSERSPLLWQAMNVGLTDMEIVSLSAVGGTLFAGTTEGLFRSLNNGSNWSAVGNFRIVNAVYASRSSKIELTVLAATDDGLYRSTDGGTSWTEVRGEKCAAIAPDSVSIFAAGRSGVLRSSDNGATWTSVASISLISREALSITAHSGNVAVGTNYGGVILSTDNGATWKNIGLLLSEGLPLAVRTVTLIPNNVSPRGFSVLAGTQFGIFKSVNADTLWTPQSSSLIPAYTSSLCIDNDMCYAGTNGGGVYLRQLDSDGSWYPCNTGLTAAKIASVAVKGSTLMAGGGIGMVYRSLNNGTEWTRANGGIEDENIRGVGATDKEFFAGTYNGFYRSQDDGWSWHPVGSSLSDITSNLTGGGIYLFGTISAGVRRTIDCMNWETVNSGLPMVWNTYQSVPLTIRSLAACDVNVFAWTDGGLYRSGNYGSSWYAVDTSAAAKTNAPTVLAAGRDGMGMLYLARAVGGKVSLSDDVGKTWTDLTIDAPMFVTALAIAPSGAGGLILYAGTYGQSVYTYAWGKTYASNIRPAGPAGVNIGNPFTVNVSVGDSIAVKNLKTLSFTIKGGLVLCSYVDSSAASGPLMAATVNGTTVDPIFTVKKNDAQSVTVSLTAQSPPGVSGTGIAASFRYTTALSAQAVGQMVFSVSDVKATNSAGSPVYLMPGTSSVQLYAGHASVWPGDCNNDGAVNAADVLPIGVWYGRSFGKQNGVSSEWRSIERDYWEGEPPGKFVFIDANGDGEVNTADILPVGLNYGMTHNVASAPAQTPQAPSGSVRAVHDADVRIISVSRGHEDDPDIHVRIGITARTPLFGAALKMSYHSEDSSSVGARFVHVDTAGSVLAGGLIFHHAADDSGIVDLAITWTEGKGFLGEGTLLDVVVRVPMGKESSITAAITSAVADDAEGNPLTLGIAASPGVITDIDRQLPLTYALLQNYPNPFNPGTAVEYHLPAAAHVAITVFDMLGREVSSLVNGVFAAGSHTVWWDASAVSSGVYYYRMTARESTGGTYVQTRRMALVK
jgi:hypothetical protein